MISKPTHDVVAASVAAYSSHAAAYDSANAGLMAPQRARFIASLAPAAAVLDAGCGPGRDLRAFREAGLNAVGLDLNETFCAMAARHGPVTLGDLRHLPYAGASFAGVWSCASLVHLPPEAVSVSLAEMARVLVPAGQMYVSVKLGDVSGWRDSAHGTRWFSTWHPQVFCDLVAASGFVVDATAPVTGRSDTFLDLWAHKPSV